MPTASRNSVFGVNDEQLGQGVQTLGTLPNNFSSVIWKFKNGRTTIVPINI